MPDDQPQWPDELTPEMREAAEGVWKSWQPKPPQNARYPMDMWPGQSGDVIDRAAGLGAGARAALDTLESIVEAVADEDPDAVWSLLQTGLAVHAVADAFQVNAVPESQKDAEDRTEPRGARLHALGRVDFFELVIWELRVAGDSLLRTVVNPQAIGFEQEGVKALVRQLVRHQADKTLNRLATVPLPRFATTGETDGNDATA